MTKSSHLTTFIICFWSSAFHSLYLIQSSAFNVSLVFKQLSKTCSLHTTDNFSSNFQRLALKRNVLYRGLFLSLCQLQEFIFIYIHTLARRTPHSRALSLPSPAHLYDFNRISVSNHTNCVLQGRAIPTVKWAWAPRSTVPAWYPGHWTQSGTPPCSSPSETWTRTSCASPCTTGTFIRPTVSPRWRSSYQEQRNCLNAFRSFGVR